MIINPDIAKLDKKQPYVWIATWFGCGLINKAPGTWGTLGAIPVGLLLLYGGGPLNLILGICVVTALGFWSAHEFSKATGTKDSKMIVIDEVAGMWIALLAAGLQPLLIVVAFASFRLFDIWKPWPVSYFDRMDGAKGIMLDDIVAGIMAAIVTYGAYIAFFG